MCVQSLKERLGANAKAVQIPIGIESTLRGAVDIIEKKAWVYESDVHEEPHEIPIPEELKDEVELKRAELLEALASFDDDFMMKVLEGEDPSVEEIKAVIRKAVLLLLRVARWQRQQPFR